MRQWICMKPFLVRVIVLTNQSPCIFCQLIDLAVHHLGYLIYDRKLRVLTRQQSIYSQNGERAYLTAAGRGRLSRTCQRDSSNGNKS